MPEKHELSVKTQKSIVYLQLKCDEMQNGYLTQTMIFLAGVELKKLNPGWEWELTYLF